MKINSLLGKQTLALVRGGDYAHAGGEEIIDLLFSKLPKEREQKILDVGCGIGGTADYIQTKEWGQVTGIDLDPDNIEVARNTHESVMFCAANVLKLSEKLQETFDIIYLFNAFYAFSDQPRALKEMRKVAKPTTSLAIVDYADRRQESSASWQKTHPSPFIPIQCNQIEPWLTAAGWTLKKMESLDQHYAKWYVQLVGQIEEKKEEIIKIGGFDWFKYVLRCYENFVQEITQKQLGGAIVYAQAADSPQHISA